MPDICAPVDVMNEVLNSLYVVLASLKGYSSTEGNRLVEAAILALERVTQAAQDLPKCEQPDAGPALEEHSRELHLLLERLADLQDASAARRREEEAGVLRKIVHALERLQSRQLAIIEQDPAAAAAWEARASYQTADEEEEEQEDDDDDDPFFIPLPSAIKMADAKHFFVLAQPLVAEPTPFMIVMETDTSSLNGDGLPSGLSTRVGSRGENDLGFTKEATADSARALAVMTAAAAAEGGSALAASALTCPGPAPEPHTPCKGDDQQQGERTESSIDTSPASSSPSTGSESADEKHNQLVEFLEGKSPGSNMFHETMQLTLEGCRKLSAIVASSGRVRAVTLSRNNIGDLGLSVLCKGLSTNRSITALDLPDNNITDAGIAELSLALANHPTLTRLQLSNNAIADIGAVRLAELISSCRSLSQLGLSHNNIGKAGCEALRDAICTNPSLKQLQLLPGNPVTEKEAKALSKALKRNNSFSFQRMFLLAK